MLVKLVDVGQSAVFILQELQLVTCFMVLLLLCQQLLLHPE